MSIFINIFINSGTRNGQNLLSNYCWRKHLSLNKMNSNNSKAELTQIISKLKQCKIPSLSELKLLLDKSKQILSQQSNMAIVSAPVMICGDIHGQFQDLMELFAIGGELPTANYLFLGDYVDRGHHSVECVCLLLALKLKYPNRITLLRGNHESRITTVNYGFYDECNRKYGNFDAWKMLMQVFDLLPISALVENSYLGMHGGLSPSIQSIDDLRKINRNQQIPTEGPMSDFLWSDPSEKAGWNINYGRGIGFNFGADVSQRFTHHNGLKMITRAHQLMMNGYEKTHDQKVLTIFSAPNYCYRCGNQAAIMQLDENLQTSFITYDHAPDHNTINVDQKRVPDYFL